MTLNDFLKRVRVDDLDRMMLWSDGKGWSNVKVDMDDNYIYVLPDMQISPFSSDK